MTETSDKFRAIEQEILEDMKKRRASLDRSIQRLEQSLSEPPFVSHIFNQVKE